MEKKCYNTKKYVLHSFLAVGTFAMKFGMTAENHTADKLFRKRKKNEREKKSASMTEGLRKYEDKRTRAFPLRKISMKKARRDKPD